MSDDVVNGRATIREVRDLLQTLDDKMDERFASLSRELESKYVLRAACNERSHVPLSDLIKELDKRYASKTSQLISYALVGTVSAAVLYRLLALAGL